MSDREQEIFEKCQAGDLCEVQILLDQGLSCDVVQTVHVKDGNQSKEMSLLCIAALQGHLEVTRLLVAKGADVNYRCKLGESALFFAVQKGHVKVAQCLLDANAQCVYTAKPGEKVLYENWEVFTQALRNAYPRDINHSANSAYKSVVQLLLEHNANSQRPSILYEALYCSLTVFANPIAVYCVGVYSTLCSDLPAAIFSEENFLSALCHAYDVPRASDFINTVHALLVSSKLRQKDIAHNLVKLFNWSDLLRRLAEDISRCHSSDLQETGKVINQLMRVLHMLVAHFNVRADIQGQFRTLSVEDMGRIGRLIKFALGFEAEEMDQSVDASNDKSSTWQFYFFLLKQQLRDNLNTNVARLLLRSPSKRNQETNNSSSNTAQFGTEFERRVLVKCLDDDISLVHMLLDFGVTVNGECLVKFVQHGYLDLVNRCVGDRELIFCKEIEQLLKIPVAVRNSGNRNMRRCLKIIKSERNCVEEERNKFEAELLMDECLPHKKGKKKKRPNLERITSSELKEDKEDGVRIQPQDLASFGDLKNPETKLQQKHKPSQSNGHSFSKSTKTKQQNGGDDANDRNVNGRDEKQEHGASKKKRNRKKNGGKNKQSKQAAKEEEDIETMKHVALEHSKTTNTCTDWKEMMQASSRRRRQSSSSSDCSVGSRKSVHFSHPLNFYENRKNSDYSVKIKLPLDDIPKASSLKQTLLTNTSDGLAETYRTKPEKSNAESMLKSDTVNANDTDCAMSFGNLNIFDDEFYGNIPWKCVSQRWAPRFEDLSETEPASLRQMHWTHEGSDETVYFCDKQWHLNVGSGPDFSKVFLGLTGKGQEVSIKKISCKRSPLLTQKQVVDQLLGLSEHDGINAYHAIIRDRSHFYMLQTVGEYSLEQIFRKKMTTLPQPVAEACHQVAKGIAYLHKHDILHMAIKPNNVFLGSDGKLRLADYGIHCRQTSNVGKLAMSPTSASMCWLAGEIMSNDNSATPSKLSDVSSLGMIMYYIMTGGGHPFGDPDTIPGVCLSNISRGIFNLKLVTHPLAHHLLRNMIVKEPEKRLTILEVTEHPYFWADLQRDHYITMLTETALSGGATQDGRSVMQELAAIEKSIMKGLYNSKLVDVPEIYLSSIKGLLTLLYDCMHNNDLYAHHTTAIARAACLSPQHYFCICFPGLLTQTYNKLTYSDLESAILGIDGALTSPPLSPMDACDLQSSVIAEVLGEVDRCESISPCSVEENSTEEPCNYDNQEDDGATLEEIPLEAESASATENSCNSSIAANVYDTSDADIKPDVTEGIGAGLRNSAPVSQFEIPIEQKHTSKVELPETGSGNTADVLVSLPSGYLSGPSRDKKNTNLCLLTMQNSGSDDTIKPDLIAAGSDTESDDNILLSGVECGWDLESKTDATGSESNVDGAKGNGETTPGERVVQNGEGHKRTNLESNYIDTTPEVGSPDDWIEVGSPLMVEHARASKSIVIDSSGCTSADDSPASTSSGCSVDDCFDFGNFADSSNGSWPDKVDFNFNDQSKISMGFAERKVTENSALRWTDIDELD